MGLLRRRKDEEESGALGARFQTKSHSWAQVGLAHQLNRAQVKRARREVIALLPLLVGVLLLYRYRDRLFGLDTPIRVFTVVALVALGWAFARAMGRAMGPALFRRMDPSTAGTVGFLIRLSFIGITVLVALNVAGLEPRNIAVSAGFAAVIFGLAAQQTLGNLIAGTVLLSARPFKVGDRVRFQGGPVAGTLEGIVSSLGLLYTTLADGDDMIMVPNNAALACAVSPLEEPDAVDLRARLPVSIKPSDLQALLDVAVTTPTREEPKIVLEEVDGDEVVVRIEATPVDEAKGAQLADEVLAAVAGMQEAGLSPDEVPPAADGTPAREEATTPSRTGGS